MLVICRLHNAVNAINGKQQLDASVNFLWNCTKLIRKISENFCIQTDFYAVFSLFQASIFATYAILLLSVLALEVFKKEKRVDTPPLVFTF